MEEMDLGRDGFLEAQLNIVDAYTKLGIRPTLSCTPYDRGEELEEGIACWAESNAVCFANSWTKMRTNRESGLSALATALTGFAPRWGLHLDRHRVPNIRVNVTAELRTLADYSILGDWIGAQAEPGWSMPWGPMPFILGLEAGMTFAERKALTAAAANYGTPMLWVNGVSTTSTDAKRTEWAPPEGGWQGTLVFDDAALAKRKENSHRRAPSTSSSSAVRKPPSRRFGSRLLRSGRTPKWVPAFLAADFGCSPAERTTPWPLRTALWRCSRRVERWC